MGVRYAGDMFRLSDVARLAAEGLYRPASSGGGGGGITQLTGAVLAGPGSGVQAATIAGGFANVVYVTPSGNDTTGDGTIYKPWLTISHAVATVPAGTPGAPSLVVIGPGTYTESVALRPNINLVGLDQAASSVTVTGNVTLSAAQWTAASGHTAVAAASNLTVAGTVVLNFATATNIDGTIEFVNVAVESATTVTGDGPSLGNTFLATLVNFEAHVTVTGALLQSQATNYEVGLTLTATATLGASWVSVSDGVDGTVTLTGAAETALANLIGTGVAGVLTLNNPTTNYTTSSIGVPATVNLTGGAPAPAITTSGIVASGTTTLVAGVSPTIAVPSLTASSLVMLTLRALNASTALGIPYASTITPGTSFQITSAEPGTPGTPQTGDASTYNWVIVNGPP